MSFKCPDCGATLKDDSQFCNYCGAKIDDGVKRMEIKIDKRIEDVAEVKRAGYEEKESAMRIRKAEAEFKGRKVKRITALVLLVFCSISFVLTIINWNKPSGPFGWVHALGSIGFFFILGFIIHQLLKVKW